ncbi:MAG: hypothetical protein GKS00_01305 [Alphaproteobacteria bacterium]|nr:hypothetical protein [Alphaproteobacteria bacterium]
MQDIRTQRDLERLPQPRLIFTAKPWVRRGATGFLTLGALGCAAIAFDVSGPAAHYYAFGATIAAIVCLAVIVFARPYDWRAWVNVAATLDGLYITAAGTRLIFVPWQNVIDIGTERMFMVKGGPRNFPRLKLRLSEADWSLFGNLSSIKGTGPVRSYIFSPVSGSAELAVEQLKAFRGSNKPAKTDA